jgi:hypothetical protein
MSLKKDNRRERRRAKGGFNPMNVGYSGNADVIRDSNGVLVDREKPYPPKPPKGGTGESSKPTPPTKQIIIFL